MRVVLRAKIVLVRIPSACCVNACLCLMYVDRILAEGTVMAAWWREATELVAAQAFKEYVRPR